MNVPKILTFPSAEWVGAGTGISIVSKNRIKNMKTPVRPGATGNGEESPSASESRCVDDQHLEAGQAHGHEGRCTFFFSLVFSSPASQPAPSKPSEVGDGVCWFCMAGVSVG